MRSWALCSLGLLILSGCATERAPLIEEELMSWGGVLQYSYLSTAPERRVVIFRYEDRLVCAESPADAADQIASFLSTGATGKGIPIVAGQEVAKTEVALEYQKALATSIKQLFRRTQLLQLYRDRVFNLCLLRLNGLINPAEYAKREDETFKAIMQALPGELALFYEKGTNLDTTPPPSLPQGQNSKKDK